MLVHLYENLELLEKFQKISERFRKDFCKFDKLLTILIFYPSYVM